MINVTIKTLDSQSRQFSVPDTYTVKQLKDHIASVVQIPVENQRFIYYGRVLQNDRLLSDCGVDGNVIHLVTRPPPGVDETTDNVGQNTNHRGAYSRSGGPALYLGAVAFPSDYWQSVNGIQRTGSAYSRLVIARGILRRVQSSLNELEHSVPVVPTNNSRNSQINENIPSTSDTSNTDELSESIIDSSDRFVEDPPNDITADEPMDFQDTQNEENNEHQTANNASVDGGSATSGANGSASSTRSNNVEDYTLDEGAEEGRHRGSRPAVMAHILQTMANIQRRLWPYMAATHRLLTDDDSFTDQSVINQQDAQSIYNTVSTVMHDLAHAYHALSDILCDFNQPPPRSLRTRPSVLQHSALLHTNLAQARVSAADLRRRFQSAFANGTDQNSSSTSSSPRANTNTTNSNTRPLSTSRQDNTTANATSYSTHGTQTIESLLERARAAQAVEDRENENHNNPENVLLENDPADVPTIIIEGDVYPNIDLRTRLGAETVGIGSVEARILSTPSDAPPGATATVRATTGPIPFLSRDSMQALGQNVIRDVMNFIRQNRDHAVIGEQEQTIDRSTEHQSTNQNSEITVSSQQQSSAEPNSQTEASDTRSTTIDQIAPATAKRIHTASQTEETHLPLSNPNQEGQSSSNSFCTVASTTSNATVTNTSATNVQTAGAQTGANSGSAFRPRFSSRRGFGNYTSGTRFRPIPISASAMDLADNIASRSYDPYLICNSHHLRSSTSNANNSRPLIRVRGRSTTDAAAEAAFTTSLSDSNSATAGGTSVLRQSATASLNNGTYHSQPESLTSGPGGSATIIPIRNGQSMIFQSGQLTANQFNMETLSSFLRSSLQAFTNTQSQPQPQSATTTTESAQQSTPTPSTTQAQQANVTHQVIGIPANLLDIVNSFVQGDASQNIEEVTLNVGGVSLDLSEQFGLSPSTRPFTASPQVPPGRGTRFEVVTRDLPDGALETEMIIPVNAMESGTHTSNRNSNIYDETLQSDFPSFIREMFRCIPFSSMQQLYFTNQRVLLKRLRRYFLLYLRQRFIFAWPYDAVRLDIITRVFNDHIFRLDSLRADWPGVNSQIDLAATFCQFNKRFIPEMLSLIMSGFDDNYFNEHFSKAADDYFRQLATLFRAFFPEQAACTIENMFHTLITEHEHMLPEMDPSLWSWLRLAVTSHLINEVTYLPVSELPTSLLQCIVYRLPSSSTSPESEIDVQEEESNIVPIEDPNVGMIIVEQPSTFQMRNGMHNPDRESSELPPMRNGECEPTELQPPEDPIAIPTPEWRSHVPSDWVPIITRDVHKLRRQGSQPPFSDAYLSGMPKKRRKLYSSGQDDSTNGTDMMEAGNSNPPENNDASGTNE